MANWTPAGFIGQVFKTPGRYLPPPAGLASPAQWGNDEWNGATFGSRARHVEITPRNFVFRYRSPEHFMEFFRTYYGPVHKAFLALDEAGKVGLSRDLLALIGELNTARDGSMRVPSAYAQIVITKA